MTLVDTMIPFDSSWSVDEITARFPQTMPVFSRFGIDMCCGGDVSLAAAADRDGADLTQLMEALQGAAPTPIGERSTA